MFVSRNNVERFKCLLFSFLGRVTCKWAVQADDIAVTGVKSGAINSLVQSRYR